jgi:hypothetical protein
MTTNDNPLDARSLWHLKGWGCLTSPGPLTVFWSASMFMKQQGWHGYARHTVSPASSLHARG